MSSEGPPASATVGRGSSVLDEEAQTIVEVAERIAFIESPDYNDPSKRAITSLDYWWLVLAAVVAPLILFIWGASLL